MWWSTDGTFGINLNYVVAVRVDYITRVGEQEPVLDNVRVETLQYIYELGQENAKSFLSAVKPDVPVRC